MDTSKDIKKVEVPLTVNEVKYKIVIMDVSIECPKCGKELRDDLWVFVDSYWMKCDSCKLKFTVDENDIKDFDNNTGTVYLDVEVEEEE